MKHMKKIASFLLAAIMVLAMVVPTFAANDKTITITNAKKGHTYTAYQIFSGTVAGSELKNIQWGTGVSDAYKNAKGNAAEFAAGLGSTAADAKALAKEIYDTETNRGTSAGSATATADGTVTITNLPDGYYLIVDTSTGTVGDTNDVYAEYIVKLAGKSVSVKDKSDVPTVEKKLKDYDGSAESAWNDAADYNIGDSIPFQITGTLPGNYASYSKYYYKFTDTPTNLTITRSTVKVMAGEKDITSYATITINSTTGVMTVEFDDLKDSNKANITDASTKIVLTYNAVLANTAVIGLDGNPNKVDLTFSNNPNKGGEGDTSKTPEDEVLVFTYELDVTKVDGANASTKLKDAQFVLKAVDGKNVGKYVKLDANGKISGWLETKPTAIASPESITAAAELGVLISDTNGLVKITGLDAGKYELEEIKAPTGYNLLSSPISLEIIATQSNLNNYKEDGGAANAAAVLTALKIKVGEGTATDGTLSSGIVGTTVENNSGASLPETGGIGTTIFYVLGSILVLGAVILLATRRRMSR